MLHECPKKLLAARPPVHTRFLNTNNGNNVCTGTRIWHTQPQTHWLQHKMVNLFKVVRSGCQLNACLHTLVSIGVCVFLVLRTHTPNGCVCPRYMCMRACLCVFHDQRFYFFFFWLLLRSELGLFFGIKWKLIKTFLLRVNKTRNQIHWYLWIVSVSLR